MRIENYKKTNISLCLKKLWLDANRADNAEHFIDAEGDYSDRTVRELVCRKMKGCVQIKKDIPSVMAEETALFLEKSDRNKKLVITDAVFLYGEIVVYIDRLMRNSDGSFEICEIKAAVHIRDGFVKDVSFKCAVLSLLGYKVARVYIGYINDLYVKNGEIEIKKFLNFSDVTESVKVYSAEMKSRLIEVAQLVEEPEKTINISCLSPRKCSYWKYCTRELPKYNVFDVSGLGMDKKFEIFEAGIVSFEEIEEADCVSKRQMRQITSVVHDLPPEIDSKSIKKFLSELYYPLYFLDFETFQSAIPKYDGVRPFTQIPFQFSLHYIEKEGGELCHREFLAEYGADPRRELAEKLVKYIPRDACVLAYNMAFEKGVISNLASMFEDLSVPLMMIHKNIKDLMVPFQKQYYYDKNMNGSYSIKAVLPALFPDDPELDYKNLDLIHNGIEAMVMYQRAEEFDAEKIEAVRNSLLKYCGLDTFAMVKIWEKLKEVV